MSDDSDVRAAIAYLAARPIAYIPAPEEDTMPDNELGAQAPIALDATPTASVAMPAMPNITQAQFQAFVATLATALTVLFKLNLTDAQQAGLVSGLAGVYAVAHVLGDALIRRSRARLKAEEIRSQADVVIAAQYAAGPIAPVPARVRDTD